jgi:hypothetical protein
MDADCQTWQKSNNEKDQTQPPQTFAPRQRADKSEVAQATI